MNIKLLLKIASGLLIFHLVAHSFGHSGWRKAEDPLKQEIINRMVDHKFPFMGADRSMGDYYEGYGYASTITLAFMAATLWLIAGAYETNRGLSFKILTALSVALAFWAVDEFVYFFSLRRGYYFFSLSFDCIFSEPAKGEIGRSNN